MERKTKLHSWDGWTFRESAPDVGAPERLVLLIHGWTGDENSMWVFARSFPFSVWLMAPRAPYRAEKKGFSWRAVRPETWGWPSFHDLRPAAEALLTWLDGLMTHRNWRFETFDVMGFSQGAAVAAVLLAIAPQRLGKVAMLSGFVPAGAESHLKPVLLQRKTVFMAHGRADQLVPFERAEAAALMLERVGVDVQFCAHEQGHKVDLACMQVLKQYMAAR
jgi:phospholipase/carboxylesterase